MTAKTAIKIAIGKRPHYFSGQLLLEDDFTDEQKFHVEARKRHNLVLHDWGVVRGLTITRAGEKSVHIHPGAAVDESGREIFIDEAQNVELNDFGPHDQINIGLEYEEEPGAKGAAKNRRVDYYAAVTLSNTSEPGRRLILATVTLDGQGRVTGTGIDYSRTKYVRLAPGSITATQLHDSLRKGWLRLPFRPTPMVEGPEPGREQGLPAFRVGATEALSPDPKEAGENDRGAAGTMAILIPPSARHVTRFRIAGSENKGEISFRLVKGGWDQTNSAHLRQILLDEKITRKEPFMELYEVKDKDTVLDPEYHTLSLWLRATRRTAISLIAVEFVY